MGAGGVGWAWKAGFDWNTVKSAWWLLRDAWVDDDLISTAGAAELRGRADRGDLSDASLKATVEIVLARRDQPRHGLALRGSLVVPDGEPLARLVQEPPLIQEPKFLGVFVGEVDLGGPYILVCAAVRWPRQPEVYLNYDVIVREGTQDWAIGHATRFPTGGGDEGFNGLTGFTATVVDVVLRPDPVNAGERLDAESIWGREYAFRDVQVQWVDDPSAAAEALVKDSP